MFLKINSLVTVYSYAITVHYVLSVHLCVERPGLFKSLHKYSRRICK